MRVTIEVSDKLDLSDDAMAESVERLIFGDRNFRGMALCESVEIRNSRQRYIVKNRHLRKGLLREDSTD